MNSLIKPHFTLIALLSKLNIKSSNELHDVWALSRLLRGHMMPSMSAALSNVEDG
jgi:hypothetical protein